MNSNIKKILRDYEIQRNRAISAAENKKKEIYSSTPRLQEIEDELSKCSIKKAKLMLQSDSNELIDSINIRINKLKKEKDNLLKNLGIDNSYFKPVFNCNLCEDTGYITKGYQTTMCSCLQQKSFDVEYNNLNVYNMQNQSFENFSSTVYSDKVDKQKYSSDISPRQNIEIIKEICKKFIDNFDDPKEKNLLFTGNSGLGKTFLSSCIANDLLKKKKTVLYQTAPVMLDTIINYRLRKKQFRYKHLQ